MAYKNINKKLLLKVAWIGFLLVGLFLLSYSQSVYVEEVNAGIDGSCEESFIVNMLDAMTIICFGAAFVCAIVESFARDNSRSQRRRGRKEAMLPGHEKSLNTTNNNSKSEADDCFCPQFANIKKGFEQ